MAREQQVEVCGRGERSPEEHERLSEGFMIGATSRSGYTRGFTPIAVMSATRKPDMFPTTAALQYDRSEGGRCRGVGGGHSPRFFEGYTSPSPKRKQTDQLPVKGPDG